MIVEGDCNIELNPKTGTVSVSGNIMEHVYEAGQDAFLDKYAHECVDYINSLQTTKEEAVVRFSEFVEHKVKNGTHLVILPVKTKKAGFEKAMRGLKTKDKDTYRNGLFELIKLHFTYDEECYQKLDEAINKDPNFESALISHISEKDKPEILLCFVFSFTF